MLNAMPLPTGPMDSAGGSIKPDRTPKPRGEDRGEVNGSFASTLSSVRGERPPDRNEAENGSCREAEANPSENCENAEAPASHQAGPAADAPLPANEAVAGPAADSGEGEAEVSVAFGETPELSGTAGAAATPGGTGEGDTPSGAPSGSEASGAPGRADVANAKDGIPADISGTPAGKSASEALPSDPDEGAPNARQGNETPIVADAEAETGTPSGDAGPSENPTEAAAKLAPFDGEETPPDRDGHPSAGLIRGKAAASGKGRESGVLQQETGRTDAPDLSQGRVPGGESAEAVKTLGDAQPESATTGAMDDHGPLAPRQGSFDVNLTLGTTHAAGKAAAAETGAGTAPQPAAAGSFAQDNFHHMVERALFSVRGGQSEARIALKPDQLGHVRMQIVTENQMVSIRIVTESPAARDLIDANSQQLKTDLQQQGLNVERIEVSVGQEENDAYRGSRQRDSYLRHMTARGRTSAEAGGRAMVPIPDGRVDGRGRTAGIDYFA